MQSQITIQAFKPQTAAVIEFEASMSQIGEEMGRVFGEIMAYLPSAGTSPAGPPFSAYPDMEAGAEGKWRVISGFPVAKPIRGSGRVKPYELPGGDKVAVATHMGPYDTIERTYRDLQDWIKENGFQPAGIMWESYLTDPAEEPDPAHWRTMIYCPVK